jgi:hypothetical protein
MTYESLKTMHPSSRHVTESRSVRYSQTQTQAYHYYFHFVSISSLRKVDLHK